MKTAISLPDQLYQEAEKTAKSLGIPRSRLFAKALEDFIALHNRENITERLNKPPT
jgi:metal-responsive CopG/Arc/MetJ family transcriptional regulator